MSKYKSNICPCCHKGCDLSAPRCSRGEEYLKTGVIPEKKGHRHGESQHLNYEEMNIDERIFVMLGKLSHMGRGAYDGKSSQNRILHILSRVGSMTQRELTEKLEIRPGSASEIIKKLESAGLITRQSNSEDRRTVDITLTDAGRARVEDNVVTDQNLFGNLSDEEKQQLLTLLEKVGQDWHGRFRGEGRGEHKHHGKENRDYEHCVGHKHNREGKRPHDEKHSHDEKQHRRHPNSN